MPHQGKILVAKCSMSFALAVFVIMGAVCILPCVTCKLCILSFSGLN
jgi:hypothetical protein